MIDLLPFSANVLNTQKLILNLDSNTYHERTVMDYELDFYIKGKRKMINRRQLS